MNSFVDTPAYLTAVGDVKHMTAQDLMACARAAQDWKDGVAPGHNPYPRNTSEHRYYQEEFDHLMKEEEKLEQLASQAG